MNKSGLSVLVVGTNNWSNMCLYFKTLFVNVYHKANLKLVNEHDIKKNDILVILSDFEQVNKVKQDAVPIADIYNKQMIVVDYVDTNIDIYAQHYSYETTKCMEGKIYVVQVNKKCIYYQPHLGPLCKKITSKFHVKTQYDWNSHNLDNYYNPSDAILDRDYLVRSRTLLLVRDIINKWRCRSLYSNTSVVIKERDNNDYLIDCFQYYGYKCIDKDGILVIKP